MPKKFFILGLILVLFLSAVGLFVFWRPSSQTAPPLTSPLPPALVFSSGKAIDLALDFVKSSRTYAYDGIEISPPAKEEIMEGNCSGPCFLVPVSFQTKSQGFGDRPRWQEEGKTAYDRQAKIIVGQTGILKATLDDKWNMLNGRRIVKLKTGMEEGTTKGMAEELALNFIKNTEIFDSRDGADLKIVKTETPLSLGSFKITVSFTTSAANLGQREKHTALFEIKTGRLGKATLDQTLDLLEGTEEGSTG